MRSLFAVALFAVFATACGAHGDSDVGPAPVDAGGDTTVLRDATSDSPTDSTTPTTDSGASTDTAPPPSDTSTCEAGGACTLTDPCKTGSIDCSGGSPTCVASGDVPNGTTCGTNKVCHDGSCADCTADASCTPTNGCHVGKTSCSTGVSTCDDTGANVTNGTSCGTSLVCKNGGCVACTAGAACTSTNKCKNGAIDCSTGDPVCTDASNKPDGTGCGTHSVCTGGACGCATGYTSCVGACVDTKTDPANCGACGNACESGICKNGGCETFFGAYQTGPTGCENGSPFVGGACSCPPASAPYLATPNLIIEPASSPAVEYACIAAAHTKPSDFGGTYGQKDATGGCGSTEDCVEANPFTGSCTCPAGTNPITMRIITDPCSGTGMIGGYFTFCYNHSAPLVSFGGAYEYDDATAGGVGCRVANPATGGCSCPGGTSPGPVIRVWVDSSAGIIGSAIFVCSAP